MKRPRLRQTHGAGTGSSALPRLDPGHPGGRDRAYPRGSLLRHARAGRLRGLPVLPGAQFDEDHRQGRTSLCRTSVLLVSNHRTMFDSFLVASTAYFPSGLIYPSLPPYHAAAQENYFRWYHLGFFRLLRCIPVRAGRKDLEAMNALKEALTKGNAHVFYQGRRSQDLEEARAGIGYIVYNARPIVVPVYVDGIEKIFGRKWGIRALFRRIKVVYGRSIDFVDLYSMPNSKETWSSITQRIVAAREGAGGGGAGGFLATRLDVRSPWPRRPRAPAPPASDPFPFPLRARLGSLRPRFSRRVWPLRLPARLLLARHRELRSSAARRRDDLEVHLARLDVRACDLHLDRVPYRDPASPVRRNEPEMRRIEPVIPPQ